MLGCPKLTALQSRLAASVAALALLALIYWTLSSPTFAYAAELEIDGTGASRTGEDHNWHRIAEELLKADGIDAELRPRAAAMAIGGNNVGNLDNIEAGNTTRWSYSKTLLFGNYTSAGSGYPLPLSSSVAAAAVDERHDELRKRLADEDADEDEEPRTIYISINTCVQPDWVGNTTQTAAPPQLTLYVSTNASNHNPGPDGDADAQIELPLSLGFANATVVANTTWYMSVHAPALTSDFSGVWNYELAVSIDGYYHHAHPFVPYLFLIDSDSQSALLVTENLTYSGEDSLVYKEWMNMTDPYTVFASNQDNMAIAGMTNSYCGLSKVSQIVADVDDPTGASNPVQMQMTTRGAGSHPKEQFYIRDLNRSSSYLSTLARVGNGTASGSGVVGGGGSVWAPVAFTTQSDGNCALIFNLEFCNEVAYAVPATPDFAADADRFNHFYDNYTLHYYRQFNYTLHQIPCRTTDAAQFSLATDCSQCAAAYKDWLCAVSIPRCADFTRPASDTWLQPRNMAQAFYNNGSYLSPELLYSNFVPMPGAPTLEGSPAWDQTYLSSLATNSSRNVQIDQVIAPGPYKEVLPCDDLCYSLARSCPAALGFTCPYAGRGLEMGYGRRNPTGNGTITCSYPGAYVAYSAASRVAGGPSMRIGLAALMIVFFHFLT